MPHVAFLSNLNQGQRGNPTSQQLVDSFARAGASEIRLVRGNGTVVYEAAAAAECAAAAVLNLADTGWRDVAFVRSLAAIARILETVPPDSLAVDARRLELSVFDDALTPSLPLTGRRCRVVAAGAGYAITLNERANESNGTPALERALGSPVTSRGLTTVRMLAG